VVQFNFITMQSINRIATGLAIFAVTLLVGVGSAHALTDGQLAKSTDSSAVYKVENGILRPFLNSRIFHTYYSNFEAVVVTDLSSLTVGEPMPPKAGTKMIKFPSDTKVYTLEEGKVLRHVPNQETAKALFGEKWNKEIIELPADQTKYYSIGEQLEEKMAEESTDTKNEVADPKTTTDETSQTTTDTTTDTAPDSTTSISVSYSTAVAELAKVNYKNTRSGENVYQGSFPAPKGTALDHGYVGLDVTVEPSGTGAFKYSNKIWTKDPIICRDGVREYYPSTGAEWEVAWKAGRTEGKTDYTRIEDKTIEEKYNPSVPTAYAGTELNDIWVDGYNQEFKMTGKFDKYVFVCSQALGSAVLEDDNHVATALKGFDEDGWQLKPAEEFTFDMHLPNVWPSTQPFASGERARIRMAEDDPNYKLITTGDNPETKIEAIDIVEYDADAYSRNSNDTEADLTSTATQIAELRVNQKVAEPGNCKLLDPRYKAWQQVKGGVYETILPSTYDGMGYSVAPYKIDGKNGVVLTYNEVCQNDTGESFIKYGRMFFFLTDADRLIQMSVNWDNKVLIDGNAGQTILSQLKAVPADSVFDGAIFEQFISKLGNNIR